MLEVRSNGIRSVVRAESGTVTVTVIVLLLISSLLLTLNPPTAKLSQSTITITITMADSKRISVHRVLGEGLVADVALWKNWRGAVAVLVSATALWYLFERAGYNFLSFVANVVLLLVVILFFWAKAANLLNRPLPPLPDLEISEETIARVADALQNWMNRALSVAHDIAIERNLLLCLQVVGGLWLISYIGSLFNFLTLIYVGVLLSLSLPVLYDKYQDQIDDRLGVVHGIVQAQYKKIHSIVLSKIPKLSNKEKKVQ